MHWPEELVVGGARHNKTGHLTRAAALQTVVQLMGERELYDFLANTYRVHHIDWTQEKAAKVLETWQRVFSNEVKKLVEVNVSAPYNLYAFSTTTMNDILGKYSEVSITKIAIAGMLMVRNNSITLINYVIVVQCEMIRKVRRCRHQMQIIRSILPIYFIYLFIDVALSYFSSCCMPV